jgi:hypothetical protein
VLKTYFFENEKSAYFLVPAPEILRKMKMNRLIWMQVLQDCLKEILISAFAMYYKTVKTLF